MGALYEVYKEGVMNKEFDLNTDNVVAILTDTGTYTPDIAADNTIGDVTGAAGTATTLSSVTITNGVLDSAAVTFSSVATGNSVEAVVLAHETSRKLIVWTSLTVAITPNDSDIEVTPHASGWCVT